MSENVIEKTYSKIDEALGEDHVRDVVQNLVNVENSQEAYQNLMKLHEQCCTVFSKFPQQTPGSRKTSVTQRKSTPAVKK